MKEYLAELVRAAPTPVMARNTAREYLQARMLASLQRAGAMIPLAFHGGTALRFLYSTARYSEDLDFALEKNKDRYDFRAYLQSIQRDFRAESYNVDVKVSDQKTAHSAFIRFPGLLHELKLSPHADEVLSVKLEVDTNPLAGAQLATTLIRRHVPLRSSTMTAPPCWRENFTRYGSVRSPKDVTCTTCSGTLAIPLGPLRILFCSTTP